jgi:hypothetical protein
LRVTAPLVESCEGVTVPIKWSWSNKPAKGLVLYIFDEPR